MKSHRWSYLALSDILSYGPQDVIKVLLRVLVRSFFNLKVKLMIIRLIQRVEMIFLRNFVFDIDS